MQTNAKLIIPGQFWEHNRGDLVVEVTGYSRNFVTLLVLDDTWEGKGSGAQVTMGLGETYFRANFRPYEPEVITSLAA